MIVRQIIVLFMGAGLGAAAAFALQATLARSLTVSAYGEFSALYTTALGLTPLAGMGIAGYLLRCYGRYGEAAKKLMHATGRYVFISLFFSIGMFCLIGFVGLHEYRLVFGIGSVIIGGLTVELVLLKNQLEGRFYLLAFWQFFPHGIRLAVVAITLSAGYVNLYAVVIAIFIACMIAVFFSLKDIRNLLLGNLNLNLKMAESGAREIKQGSVSSILHGAWPFGVSGFLFLSYFQGSVFLANIYLGEESAAYIAVCVTLLTAIYLVPTLVFQRLFSARIAFWVYNDIVALRRFFRFGALSMALIGVGVSCILYLLSEWFVVVFFGENYKSSEALFGAALMAVPARFLGASFGAFLITERQQRTKIAILLLAVLSNILVSFYLSGILGSIGIIYSLVFTEWLVMALLFVATRNFRGYKSDG